MEMQNTARQDSQRESRAAEYLEIDETRPFLGPLLDDLRPYRRIVGGVLGIALFAMVVLGLALWILYPTTKIATLVFRLDFDGVGEGTYPNGSKFSVEDLLSEPVIRRVYDENGLKSYLKFETFRSSLFVTSKNPALDLLELEYKARLSESKLQPVDRQRIEREFREKAAALKTGTFTLTMTRKERLREMDAALMEKVLRGILISWADDAAKMRGALKYDIPTYSRAIVQRELLQSEDFLVGVDRLRTMVNRAIASVRELMKIPGIRVVRLPGSGVSLEEVRIRLEDLNRFRIAPAIGFIRSTGIFRNPALTVLYVDDRLFDVNLEQTLAQARESKMRESFAIYTGSDQGSSGRSTKDGERPGFGSRDTNDTTVIPQFGESFIDRIMELSNRDSDFGFRQDLTERMIASGMAQVDAAKETAFYRELQAGLRSGLKSGSGVSNRAETIKEFEARFAAAADDLEKDLDDIQAIYELVSARNLRPASALFSTERPMALESTSALSFTKFLALAMLFVLAAGIAAAVAALFHARFEAVRRR